MRLMFFGIIIGIFLALFLLNGRGIFTMRTWSFSKRAVMAMVILAIVMGLANLYLFTQRGAGGSAFLQEGLMLVLGVLVVSLSVIAVFWLLEGGLRIFNLSMVGKIGGSLMLIAIVLCSWWSWRLAHAIELKTITIPVDNLTSPSKILYLSDVHIAHKSDLPFLHKIIDIINQTSADFVVINWDFVDGHGFENGDFDILNTIDKPVVFTYGNHEAYVGNSYVADLLASTNLITLSDQKIQLKGREILGLADMSGFDNEANHQLLASKLEQFPRETDLPKLLLLHEPIWPQIAENYGVNLQLAGHTHYGQISPFTLAVKWAFPYIKGLYSFETSSLFVSSGVGTWWPSMRRGSRSEMLLLDLVPKQ